MRADWAAGAPLIPCVAAIGMLIFSAGTITGPNVSKDMDTPHRDQGAIDLTVMPDGSGSLKVERWDSDEVRQTAVESQVSIRHRALELQRPIRLRLSLAAC